MPFSFLSNLGSGIARLGSGFAHGAASVGKGIGRGVRRLGELGEGDYDLGPGETPPFVPRSSSGQVGAPDSAGRFDDIARNFNAREDAVALAEDFARDRYGTKPMPLMDGETPDLPIARRDLPIPAPTPAPSLAELRSPLPSLRPTPRVTPAAAPAAPRGPVPDLVPEMDMDRRNLPIPRLPGHAGGPISYNSTDAAEYDYVMKHAKRDAAGNPTRGFNRDWKTIVQNVLLGASGAMAGAKPGEDPLGRVLGGAIAAGAGSAINPQAGYEFNFNTAQRPKMEAEQARDRAEKDRLMADIVNQAKLDDLRATTEERRAQAKKLGQPERRSVSRTIGINRQTGQREFFDANDPAQLAAHIPESPKSTARDRRLGRNVETGEIDYYDVTDPEQAALFEPYQFQRERQQPGGVLAQIGKIKKLKRAAQTAWGDWGKETDPEKRRQMAESASAAQAAYNDEVATLGEVFPDLFETGGFTEANGNAGWAYYKPRQGAGQSAPQRSSRPTRQRKAVVGPDFVKHVADTLKVSPERARQIVIDDGYEVR
jgi:hypothetical protein